MQYAAVTAAVTRRATSTTRPGPLSTAPSHDDGDDVLLGQPADDERHPREREQPEEERDPQQRGGHGAAPQGVAAVPPGDDAAQPMARKRSALKTACDHRWNRPASGPASGGRRRGPRA